MAVIRYANNLESSNTYPNNSVATRQTHSVVSFVQALKEKYVDQDELDNQIVIPKDKSISTDITFVGFGTVSSVQKQLKRLSSIDLSYRDITKGGNIDELKGMLNSVILLNLAGDKLNWQEIINILHCLPNLKEIIITGNDLGHVDSNINYPDKPFKKLSSLTLGRIGTRWRDMIDVISRIWVGIQAIDLWDNQMDGDRIKLSHSKDYNDFINQILEFRLSQNNFTDISWLVDMGDMHNLRDLDLSRCKLDTIILDKDLITRLGCLQSLNISYNNISDWRNISSLNSLPSLISLICNDNPFFICEKLARPMVIARLSKLRLLNRQEVGRTARRDAEILYLRKFFPDYNSYKGGDDQSFLQCHPRYEELAELYGLPEDLNNKKALDKYITVNLCHDNKRIVKKLSHDMRISNVQMLCKRLFKLRPSSKIEILCFFGGKSGTSMSYPLDQEGQTLHFFSVKDNYNLVIKKLER